MPKPQKSPSKNPHGLLLSLLFLVLVASLGVLTLVFMMKREQLSENEVISLCAQRAAASAATATQSIANACDDDNETVSLMSVAAANEVPGFSYPETWSAVHQDTYVGPDLRHTFYLNNGLILFCEACDGPAFPITMTSEKINLATLDSGSPVVSFADFANNRYYSDPNIYTNVIKSSAAEGTGTRYTYTGYEDGLFSGNFETIVYEGAEYWVRVTYFDQDPAETETNNAWELVKESLDFSLVP